MGHPVVWKTKSTEISMFHRRLNLILVLAMYAHNEIIINSTAVYYALRCISILSWAVFAFLTWLSISFSAFSNLFLRATTSSLQDPSWTSLSSNIVFNSSFSTYTKPLLLVPPHCIWMPLTKVTCLQNVELLGSKIASGLECLLNSLLHSEYRDGFR